MRSERASQDVADGVAISWRLLRHFVPRNDIFLAGEASGLTSHQLRPRRGVWANKSIRNASKTLFEPH